jgi:STAND-like protein
MMEAIAAGSGVLAFITVTLKSAQSIHSVLSGIKNASTDVIRLSTAINNLIYVLQQIVSLSATKCDLSPHLDVSTLMSLVQKCAEDLVNYNVQIRKLSQKSTDGSGSKMWKVIKSTFKKDELEKIWVVIQHHVSVLTLQIGILQRYTLISSICRLKFVEC